MTMGKPIHNESESPNLRRLTQAIRDEAPAESIPEQPPDNQPVQAPYPLKSPAAVALGTLGGKKGGPARAKKLSPERRQEMARHAARARWAQRPSDDS
jgi:hypothetical protein